MHNWNNEWISILLPKILPNGTKDSLFFKVCSLGPPSRGSISIVNYISEYHQHIQFCSNAQSFLKASTSSSHSSSAHSFSKASTSSSHSSFLLILRDLGIRDPISNRDINYYVGFYYHHRHQPYHHSSPLLLYLHLRQKQFSFLGCRDVRWWGD